MRIEVTQDHIERGVRKDSCNCPIVHALKPFISDKFGVIVDGLCVEIVPWDEVLTAPGRYARLPDGAREFALRFDLGKPVSPFAFDLDIAQELLKENTV